MSIKQAGVVMGFVIATLMYRHASGQTPCGGVGQRACCLGERPGSACNAGLHEAPGCRGDCRCARSLVSSSGTCRPDRVTPCGGVGQRACCLGERATGACDRGLYERRGAPAGQDNTCRGGLAKSSGTCIRVTSCGGVGERACCLGERTAGACDRGLYEEPGAPAGQDNTCRGGLARSSGTCFRFLPCGGDGQRACCVGERAQRCDPGMIEVAGALPHSRCTNSLLSSSTRCRKANPHFELPFTRGECSRVGWREWTAAFVEGDRGTCEKTSADVAGTHFARPSRCRQEALRGVWGELDVADASCRPRFEAPAKGLCEGTKRWYRAYLREVPRLENGVALCMVSSVMIGGKQMSPTRCQTDYTGVAGEFLIDDPACNVSTPPDQPSCSGVAEVVGQNQTRRELSVWTWDPQGSLLKQVVRRLTPDQRFSLTGASLPADGHVFDVVFLDITAVLQWNNDHASGALGTYDPDSTGRDGAIYTSNFYSSQVTLAACRSSGIGFSMETRQYYYTGAAREAPLSAAPRILRAPPFRAVKRPDR